MKQRTERQKTPETEGTILIDKRWAEKDEERRNDRSMDGIGSQVSIRDSTRFPAVQFQEERKDHGCILMGDDNQRSDNKASWEKDGWWCVREKVDIVVVVHG